MELTLLAFLSSLAALIAAAFAVLTARTAYACAASISGRMSSLEKTERLTPSSLAQLAEFRAAIDSAEDLLAKVNRRMIAAGKARTDDGTFRPRDLSGPVSKDELRRAAGLRAGQPAPHN